MFNKIYVNFKKIFLSYKEFIIGLIIGIFITCYQFPYYISAPGGTISVLEKINLDGYDTKGSFNMAYVTDYKPNLINLILAKINKDYDIVKKETNTLAREEYIADRLMLDESQNAAVIYAYKRAGKDVSIKDMSFYVTYIYDEANTSLKIGDRILKIDGEIIQSKADVINIVRRHNEGDNLQIEVLNDNKTYERNATVIDVDGLKIIGIAYSVIYDYETNPKVTFNFSKNELGPSAGLMMSLTIYNSLVPEDITNGLKIAGTGTIDIDGNVGSIGGVKYKIMGAVKDKIKYFLVPSGENYDEAIKVKKEKNYDINIYPVSTFDGALNILQNLE